jgi:hypothetical protein
MIKLKRTKIIAIGLLMLCSTLLLVSVGTVMAYDPGYAITEYHDSTGATIDGRWTTPGEWQIGAVYHFGTTQKALFIMQANTAAGYAPEFVVEFADNTLDAGDIIQVCMNYADSSTPTSGDYKFEIQGLTTKKAYSGTGTAWAESATALSCVVTAATRTTSSHDPAQHVVAEFSIDKGTLGGWGAPPMGLRVACYDASTGNWVSWPPASTANNPSTWGAITAYSADPVPEGLTIGVMMLLSSVAVIVTTRYFRKRP